MTTPKETIERLVRELEVKLAENADSASDMRSVEAIESALIQAYVAGLSDSDNEVRRLLREYANTPLTPPALRGNTWGWLVKCGDAISQLKEQIK